jgi:light-regulated signal transduction histidine kinase (bacteriophytochrome)
MGREPGQEQAFFVKDNGVGFSMALAGRLFAPFQRLHKPSEFEGTGIGLALAKRIIVRHGGTISAQSEPDQGATIRFTLPMNEQAIR